MPINVTMPALSPTMEEGNLAKWLVKEGDKVSSGDVIAEIETDKATMEVEAVDEGTVAKIVVPAGTEGVKVNAVIAILAAEGEDASATASGGQNAAASGSPAADAAVKGSTDEAKDADKRGYERAAETASASEGGSSAKSPGGSGATQGGRVFASPLARRLAKEQGVELSSVQGSGPHGRIVKADIESAAKGGAQKPASAQTASAPSAAAPAPAPAAPKPANDDAILKLFAEGSYEKIPHDGMRKTIAKRLVESKQTVPHFYLSVDCELDALLALRKQLNGAAPNVKTDAGERPAYKLSVNDMVIKAMACALVAVPDANVSWTESAMLKHRNADVGVAVSIEGGLITPIIRKADEKTLSTISNEMKDLAKRARARKLKPEEYQGGTTAVSNLGMFGIKDFSAVINPPHATILAVGAGEERAVVKNGAVTVANVMTVTLSTDHRAVDGALGAELISAFKRFIENPMSMLV
ncbi:pyruvate dehydrogenase complex dihydrolipoamide acetyltransferase [Aureimonas phyllosphaerae]|uniref:Acetyltransferase component of pyruvate dehydrogenase complex n=1 Tax=Aureimonas phyllosphaerae TaxID=1166078 RepID=A0A7W6BRV7_9HYPH|nr:pyruvate dehydrogenase complex dihydrolipoamide acetyltransferase [Aureimonas phyllosphaerae]MBB3934854.1 pyruvate dehydrogenase E2 component (dihydrolipoamide acetyltransferase) [Aureimonas phyllosphaerae]MBB3957931.1 pyruvate dehydrogenase E2 component (dihydrolipoamide acetyltransferase) [Aureimonas phyllosphaerae]SFF44111.1 pyruvate dehydrogenase E2 component (dihydrolipoamide acetyltransferase) [Aureimonas phyllosphaerae]